MNSVYFIATHTHTASFIYSFIQSSSEQAVLCRVVSHRIASRRICVQINNINLTPNRSAKLFFFFFLFVCFFYINNINFSPNLSAKFFFFFFLFVCLFCQKQHNTKHKTVDPSKQIISQSINHSINRSLELVLAWGMNEWNEWNE